MQAGNRKVLAFALILVASLPALTGCLGLGSEPLVVAASAPKAASGMTIFVVSDGGVTDRVRDTRAEYAIYFGEQLIYPPGGRGASFEVADRTGSIFVPYSQFVVGNGDYDVVIKYQGGEHRVRVNVQKWADYVYLRPFDKGTVVNVEVVLSSATGGHPADRILAQGELLLELRYRGRTGDEDRTLGLFEVKTEHDKASTLVSIPRSRFNAGPGYYSFEPVFHNDEARNNVQVGADPTLRNRSPPWNWIYIA